MALVTQSDLMDDHDVMHVGPADYAKHQPHEPKQENLRPYIDVPVPALWAELDALRGGRR